MFVLDASVALSHALGEPEFRERARRVVSSLGTTSAVVPAIWSLEFANGLLKQERGKAVTRREIEELSERWRRLPLETDTAGLTHVFGQSVELARKHNLSVYDASYLELAVRKKAPIATFDSALAEAARREGVGVFEGAAT
jgi:predicted nucleic acid-binding protein